MNKQFEETLIGRCQTHLSYVMIFRVFFFFFFVCFFFFFFFLFVCLFGFFFFFFFFQQSIFISIITFSSIIALYEMNLLIGVVMGVYKHKSEGIIIPLHKKGSVDDVNNYRGISVLSCFSKLFTSIVLNVSAKILIKYLMLNSDFVKVVQM